jgi:hypothetical protein
VSTKPGAGQTFRLGRELRDALSLPEGSLVNTLIENDDYEHNFYISDAHDTIELRISDRQKLINEFSSEQLEKMQAYLETIIPILMMQNQ